MKKLTIVFVMNFLLTYVGFSNAGNSSSQSLAFLKAVLIVGPSEGRTQEDFEEMDEIAELFISKGVMVEKFYDDQADWEKIKIASKGAGFFVYAGHGSTLGEGGKTGGLCLKTQISSKEIIEGLKLSKNAIVIFKSVCRGAGSSAGDNEDIGIDEALARVTDYSKPFSDIGASCYFANNMGHGCILFLNALFSGKNFYDCFIESTKTTKLTTTINGVKTVEQVASPDTKIELSKEYIFDKTKQISIASNIMGGFSIRTTNTNGIKKVERIPSFKEYEIAYVANPNFTINNLK
jgi:hypothetical protein